MDPAPFREPEGNERWILLASLLVALGFLVAIVLEDYEPARLAPVFMLLAYFPLIAVHELGHAAVARALGWEVEEIVIGFGTEAWRFWLRGVPVTVRSYPLSGWVRPRATTLAGVRWKSAAIYAAGPAAELLVIAGIALALGGRLFAPSDSVPVIAGQAVALAAAIDVVLNLLPRRIETERGVGLTDGMGIVASFLRPREDYARALLDTLEAEIEDRMLARDVGGTVDACARAHAALGDPPHLRSVARRALSELADEPGLAAALARAPLPEAWLPRR